MSDKINVQYESVQRSISKMESTSTVMEHTLPKNVASGNVLELVEKLNQLNEQLMQQGEEYKRMLKMHHNSAKAALHTFEQTDNQLSASIKAR